MPAIIKKLARGHPKIVVHADYAEHATTEFRELRERSVDLIIGRMSAPAADDLNVEALYEEKYYVVASARSSWARRREVRLDELVHEPWIHMPPNVIISALIAQAFHLQKLEVPPARVVSLSMHLRTNLIANAGFLSIMPNSMLQFRSGRTVAVRILPDHQLFLERVRQEGQPLIEFCALWRSDLRRQPGAGMLIDKMKHNGSGLRQDQAVIDQGRDTPVRIELEIFSGFLSVLGPVDEQKLIFGAQLFEQHVRRCIGIRREIVELVHRCFPVRVVLVRK